MNSDTNIRNKIIVTGILSRYHSNNYSDIELAATHSKNINNFEIFEKLLLKVNKNGILNNVIIKTIRYINTTASIDAIKLLIKYGANINSQNGAGQNVLSICCANSINFE